MCGYFLPDNIFIGLKYSFLRSYLCGRCFDTVYPIVYSGQLMKDMIRSIMDRHYRNEVKRIGNELTKLIAYKMHKKNQKA